MLDMSQVGKRKMLGLTTIVKGRLRGMSRKRKKTAKNGILMLQNKNSTLNFGAGCVYTKYGTIGVKVQSVQGRERPVLVKKISGVLSLADLVKKEIGGIVKQAKNLNIEPITLVKEAKITPKKKATTRKAKASRATTKKAATKKAVTKKAASKKATTKKAASKRAITKKTNARRPVKAGKKLIKKVVKKVVRKQQGRRNK